MKRIFETTELLGMQVKNRLVRSATNDGKADELGMVTQELIETYEILAKGGVGTIITGLTSVTDKEKIVPNQMAIYNDYFIKAYKELTKRVHKYDTKIIMQLVANGVQNKSQGPGVIWGPSSVKDKATGLIPEKMSKEDISYVKEAFVKGARRAKEAGFDGVQIHVAHGFLLSRFLTPYYNRRKDEYGGTIENRARLTLEICKDIRQALGPSYPVLVKINANDFMDDGLTAEDSIKVCKLLEKAGINAIEVSGGNTSSRENQGAVREVSLDSQAYFKDYADKIAQEVDIPLILVGGIRDPKKAEEIIGTSKIEYLSMSRPLIRQPDLVKLWFSGSLEPARCISCSKCMGPGETRCIFNEELARLINEYARPYTPYMSGLVNHLPMGQLALYEMGGTSSIIKNYSDNYVQRGKIDRVKKDYQPVASLEECLGKRGSYEACKDFISEKILVDGVDRIIRKILKTYPLGISSGLFHANIRLAYSIKGKEIDGKLEEEVLRALAYYVTTYRAGKKFTKKVAKEDFKENVETLFADNKIQEIIKRGLTRGKTMEALYDNKFYMENGPLVEGPKDDKVMALLELLVPIFYESNNIVVLHCITGIHGLLVLQEYFDNFEEILDIMTSFVISHLFTVEKLTFTDVNLKHTDLTWDEIKKEALKSSNVHTIKFVYSALELYGKYELEDLKAAAAKRVEKRAR